MNPDRAARCLWLSRGPETPNRYFDAALNARVQKMLKLKLVVVLIVLHGYQSKNVIRRSFSDQSVRGYLTERTCWWNEVCKEEFQSLFRCRCPAWSFCRAPGRYYNAFCSITATGYIWKQPGLEDS